MKKIVMLIVSHATAVALGFGLGIYLLPILIAPDPPTTAEVRELAGWMCDIMDDVSNQSTIEQVREQVLAICGRFPVYG